MKVKVTSFLHLRIVIAVDHAHLDDRQGIGAGDACSRRRGGGGRGGRIRSHLAEPEEKKEAKQKTRRKKITNKKKMKQKTKQLPRRKTQGTNSTR